MPITIQDIQARNALEQMVKLSQAAREERELLGVTEEEQLASFDEPQEGPDLDFVKSEEGFRGNIYLDTEGNPTIGYGFNLNEPMIREQLPIDVLEGDRPLTEDEAEPVLAKLVDVAEKDARAFVGDDVFEGLNNDQKTALNSISFNLGQQRLGTFKKMRQAIIEGNFDQAANELQDSRRGRQLPNRTRREMELLRGL
jgi:lysozyme